MGQKLIECKRFPENEALDILKQIVAGLKYLFEKNIIHRDLKPDNIFIHQGTYMIADFGFARIFKDEEKMESMVGTPLYEAPQIL